MPTDLMINATSIRGCDHINRETGQTKHWHVRPSITLILQEIGIYPGEARIEVS